MSTTILWVKSHRRIGHEVITGGRNLSNEKLSHQWIIPHKILRIYVTYTFLTQKH